MSDFAFIELRPQEGYGYADGFGRVLECVTKSGEALDIEDRVGIVANILGSTSLGVISEDESERLAGSLLERNSVNDGEIAAFGNVHKFPLTGMAADVHMQSLLRGVTDGLLTIKQVLEEYDIARKFDFSDHPILNTDGLEAKIADDGTLFCQTFDEEEWFDTDSTEAQTAESLGLTKVCSQHELVWRNNSPRFLSSLVHATLGRENDQGEFEPIVTVLGENHPLRSED